MIHRILDNSWGIHGRVASREQVQISLGFPQHQGWVELFMGWWEYAIRSWRKRAGPDATLTFLCELGPPPYAITGPDGAELSDRWQDALRMKDMIRALWQRIADEDGADYPPIGQFRCSPIGVCALRQRRYRQQTRPRNFG